MEEDKETKDSGEMVQTEVIWITRLDVVLGQIEMLKHAVMNMAEEVHVKEKQTQEGE